jgi:hypothetical protein
MYPEQIVFDRHAQIRSKVSSPPAVLTPDGVSLRVIQPVIRKSRANLRG